MIKISHPGAEIRASIQLPSSKSISNRLLMLSRMYQPDLRINHLSNSGDTLIMKKVLSHESLKDGNLNVEDAGTVMRFMIAYCACQNGSYHISGGHRMHERPVSELVDMLRLLGANIQYLEKDGFLPLLLRGTELKSDKVLDMRKLESSQFISALLMILPKVKGNPSLWIDKNMNSFSYVELSLHLMEELGFRFDFTGDRIRFVEREKTVDQIDVEPDMSSAFYWLAYAFCSESADIMLEGLGSESTQYEMKFLQNLQIEGVSWAFEKEGLRLRRKRNEARNLQRNMDFRNVPDLVPTFAMMLPFLPRGIYQWIGLEFLNSKESRREDHLSEYLRSLNIFMRKEYAHWIIDTSACEPATEYTFEVHSDHRLAMSLISLAFCSELKIHTPEVVGKSYPGFWKDLKLANFVIEDIEQQRT